MLSSLAWGMGLHAGGCVCAACAPQPVRLAVSAAPVAEPFVAAGRDGRTVAQTDRYEPTRAGQAAADDGADDATPVGDVPLVAESDEQAPAEAPSGEKSAAADGLTADELKMISDLQRRDREVRSHEAAHQSAGGGIVGGASYTFQTGPDGRRYAIGGEVSVDTSAVANDPAATITKMQQVRAAALAPADPSGQDLAVAAAAAQIIAAAQQEVTRQRSDAGAKEAKPEEEQQDAPEAEQAKRSEQGRIGVKPDEVAALLGSQQRQRWIDVAYGQQTDTGALVDLSA